MMNTSECKKLDDNKLALLSLFLIPRSLDNENWQEIWSITLKSAYMSVIKDFIDEGYLTHAKTEHRLSALFRVSDLKRVLKEHGLKVSGKKEEIISRLTENLPDEAEKMASSKSAIYICTELGSNIASSFKNDVDQKRKNAEESVISCLEQNMVDEAEKIINSFYLNLPSPMVPSGECLAHREEAKSILEIKDVAGITKEDFEKFKIESAALAIWGKGIKGPKPLLTEIYKQLNKKSALSNLKVYKEAGFKLVTIFANGGACPACEAANEKNYDIEQELKFPTLPIKNCTHEIGYCRCSYAPWDEGWEG